MIQDLMSAQAQAQKATVSQWCRVLGMSRSGWYAARMRATNPSVVLRNHLGELAIRAAQTKDFSGVSHLLHLLSHPFDEHPGFEAHADFPPDWASQIEISCSS